MTVTPMRLTLAELPSYLRVVDKWLAEDERKEIVHYLAAHPSAGVLIQGTGGVRKLRWTGEGRGKSGGVRVIYYFHSEHMPLYLLTMFAKNERANLSAAERNALGRLVDELVSIWLTR